MREKELRALPVLMATEELVMTARADHGGAEVFPPILGWKLSLSGNRTSVFRVSSGSAQRDDPCRCICIAGKIM